MNFRIYKGEVDMPNRYICDVLTEMRKCLETNNFSFLGGLIEEAQTMANRMEASLHDNNDLKYDAKRLRTIRKEKKKVKEEIEELEEEKEELESKIKELKKKVKKIEKESNVSDK